MPNGSLVSKKIRGNDCRWRLVVASCCMCVVLNCPVIHDFAPTALTHSLLIRLCCGCRCCRLVSKCRCVVCLFVCVWDDDRTGLFVTGYSVRIPMRTWQLQNKKHIDILETYLSRSFRSMLVPWYQVYGLWLLFFVLSRSQRSCFCSFLWLLSFRDTLTRCRAWALACTYCNNRFDSKTRPWLFYTV